MERQGIYPSEAIMIDAWNDNPERRAAIEKALIDWGERGNENRAGSSLHKYSEAEALDSKMVRGWITSDGSIIAQGAKDEEYLSHNIMGRQALKFANVLTPGLMDMDEEGYLVRQGLVRFEVDRRKDAQKNLFQFDARLPITDAQKSLMKKFGRVWKDSFGDSTGVKRREAPLFLTNFSSLGGFQTAQNLIAFNWMLNQPNTYTDIPDVIRFAEKKTKGGKGSGHFQHAGRPGKIGGSSPQGSAPGGSIAEGRAVYHDYVSAIIAKSPGSISSDMSDPFIINMNANNWAGLNRERAVILDKDGNLILDKYGTEQAVDFTDAEIKNMVGARLMHNHPSAYIHKDVLDEVKALPHLSGADFTFAASVGLSEITCINPYGFNKLKMLRRATQDEVVAINVIGRELNAKYSAMGWNFLRNSPAIKDDKSVQWKLSNTHEYILQSALQERFPDLIEMTWGSFGGLYEKIPPPYISDYLPVFNRQDLATTKGGKGSGYSEGHRGIPGYHGGSLPRGATTQRVDVNGKPYNAMEIIEYARRNSQEGSSIYEAVERIRSAIRDKKEHNNLSVYFGVYNRSDDSYSSMLTDEQAQEVLSIAVKLQNQRIDKISEVLGIPKDVKGWGELIGLDITKESFYTIKRPIGEIYEKVDEAMGHSILEKDIGDISKEDVRQAFNRIMYQVEADNPRTPEEIAQGYYNSNSIYSNINSWNGIADYYIGDMVEFNIDHQVSLGKIDVNTARSRGAGDTQGGDWIEMPEVMYHVTTNAGAILNDRLRSRFELGGRKSEVGLGGGTDKTVSFTEDYDTAIMIERAINEAHMVSSGKISMENLLDIANTGGGGVNKPWLKQLLKDHYRFDYEGAEGAKLDIDKLPDGLKNAIKFEWENPGSDSAIEKAWDFWHLYYVITRKLQGGFDDPLFFGTNFRNLGKLDPNQIKILQVKPIKGARGYKVGSLGEIRTVGGDTIEIEDVLNGLSPSDIVNIVGVKMELP